MATKKFIICLNDTTEAQEQQFVEYIKSINVAWWHWLSGTWLIVDRRNGLTASTLRDQVNICFPNVHCLVFELRDDNNTWSGLGPNSEEKNMFTWIRENWKMEK